MANAARKGLTVYSVTVSGARERRRHRSPCDRLCEMALGKHTASTDSMAALASYLDSLQSS